jgi:hypothetical protein
MRTRTQRLARRRSRRSSRSTRAALGNASPVLLNSLVFVDVLRISLFVDIRFAVSVNFRFFFFRFQRRRSIRLESVCSCRRPFSIQFVTVLCFVLFLALNCLPANSCFLNLFGLVEYHVKRLAPSVRFCTQIVHFSIFRQHW